MNKSQLWFKQIEFAESLVRAREEAGVSQRKLAETAGLAQSVIARLENVKTVPNLNTLLKVFEPLGYTIAVVPRDEEMGGKEFSEK